MVKYVLNPESAVDMIALFYRNPHCAYNHAVACVDSSPKFLHFDLESTGGSGVGRLSFVIRFS